MCTDLKKEFYNDVVNMIEECKRLKYTPSRLIEMLRMNNNDAVATVKTLIAKDNVTEGFTRLCLLNRLDLTLENIVSNPKFSELFTVEEIQKCKNRLE